jgi:aryl-alcohol dehydrogenase-like predicted oxidoreductase
LGAFDQAQAEGMIRTYGVSNFDAAQLTQAHAAGTPQAIQNSCSLLDRRDGQELLALCAEREVAYLAFSPLARHGWNFHRARQSLQRYSRA